MYSQDLVLYVTTVNILYFSRTLPLTLFHVYPTCENIPSSGDLKFVHPLD